MFNCIAAQIGRCVASLGSPGSELEAGLACLTAVALEGNHLCRMLVNQGALPAVLTYCSSSQPARIRISALRALGSICCVIEGIQGLSALGGGELVVGVLRDRSRTEAERREAAGVLAQVTSPWIQENTGLPAIQANTQPIILAIKDLLGATSSLETFLLCSAALANLSSLVAASLGPLATSGVTPLLLNHAAASSSSVYIQDQIVTILANLAKIPLARTQMVESECLPLLVRILGSTSRNTAAAGGDPAQAAATDRTVSKSAIALARLCVDPATADAVVRLGGPARLTGLLRRQDQTETVKMAAAAALNTISIYSTAKVEDEADILKSCGYYTSETPISSLESFV